LQLNDLRLRQREVRLKLTTGWRPRACRRAALQDAKLLTPKNEAVSSLQKAFMAREGQMIYLKCDPVLVPLRSGPDFQALVMRMNFPE